MRRDDLCQAVRDRLVRLPPPHQAYYGVVPAAPPEEGVIVGAVGARLDAAQAALAQVDTFASHLKDPYIISRILPRQEAVSSSSIEGTHSTLDELLSVEEADDQDPTSATKQVRSYALALEDFVPKARKDGTKIFTLELIADLHRAIMHDDPDYKDQPGEMRKGVVTIGGTGDPAYSTWNPPPPDRLKECVLQNVDYMHNEGMQSMTQGLITRLAVAHVHFEAVHPFKDGNGRVGRLLLPLMMAAEGRTPLYLSPYIEANKAAYYRSLKLAQQKLEWDAAVGFLADAVKGTVDELMVTRQALADLAAVWRERRKFRHGSAALKALDELPHYPVLTAARLAKLVDVSYAQANQAVAQLVEAGILKEMTGYSRNRVYAAREVLMIVNRPFGEEPVIAIVDETASSTPTP
jgi:Fic family protein